MTRRKPHAVSPPAYDPHVRRPPERIERLPPQYFAGLLGRVAKAAAQPGPPVIDLGRGNPEVGPAPHVVETLQRAAGRADVHGYAPFRGLSALKEAIAGRYRDVYGVTIDPEREVAVIPGTKAAIVELALVAADEGDTILLPDPGYPDYTSGVALAGARLELLHLDPQSDWAPDLSAAPAASLALLNYPTNPCAACAPAGLFEEAVEFSNRTGTILVHDAAYIDLIFDERKPESYLATPGAMENGLEIWTMSKTYGMAGWRIGFVVGNAEIVERLNLINDHTRVGIFRPLQEAAVAALTGPQDDVEERRATYERRRNRVLEALPGTSVSDGTFYVWLKLPDGLTADDILATQRVAVAPGGGFGPSGEGWVRLSVAVTDENLEAGLERLAPALAGRP